MSRWFVLSFFVVCLVCFVQAAPQASSEAQPTPAGKIEEAVTNVLDSLQKGLQSIMNDPGLNQIVKDSQAALANAAETIRNGAEKIMPKTDQSSEGRK